MPRIEKDQWFVGRFARVSQICDLLREPLQEYPQLDFEAKKAFRQSQCLENETVRVLANHSVNKSSYQLIMKWDGTLGWLPEIYVALDQNLRGFELPAGKATAEDFLKSWEFVPYLWGGLTRLGIDCSGFTQLYYLEVLGQKIPKNSRDQRKLGKEKTLETIANHDLVVCRRKAPDALHHVALYFEKSVWHASTEGGVLRQSIPLFLERYQIEAVVSLC